MGELEALIEKCNRKFSPETPLEVRSLLGPGDLFKLVLRTMTLAGKRVRNDPTPFIIYTEKGVIKWDLSTELDLAQTNVEAAGIEFTPLTHAEDRHSREGQRFKVKQITYRTLDGKTEQKEYEMYWGVFNNPTLLLQPKLSDGADMRILLKPSEIFEIGTNTWVPFINRYQQYFPNFHTAA
jgi:hypothetical protein